MQTRVTNGPVRAGDLFVFYGLLKQGASGMPAHIDLAGGGAFLGPCRFRARMLDLGGYPGVIDGHDLCHGVKYRLDNADLAPLLDAFEDVYPDDPQGSLYQRILIDILSPAGARTSERAWIYWYNQPARAHPIVPGGDWLLDKGITRK